MIPLVWATVSMIGFVAGCRGCGGSEWRRQEAGTNRLREVIKTFVISRLAIPRRKYVQATSHGVGELPTKGCKVSLRNVAWVTAIQ